METRQQLAKFEGQSSISSSDFYGNGPGSSGSGRRDDYYNTGPDLQDIRDGMKQSVTKVAGRLSNIANGIVSSLQVSGGHGVGGIRCVRVGGCVGVWSKEVANTGCVSDCSIGLFRVRCSILLLLWHDS